MTATHAMEQETACPVTFTIIENSIVARRDVFPGRVISKHIKRQPAVVPQNVFLVFLMKIALLVNLRMICSKMENAIIK